MAHKLQQLRSHLSGRLDHCCVMAASPSYCGKQHLNHWSLVQDYRHVRVPNHLLSLPPFCSVTRRDYITSPGNGLCPRPYCEAVMSQSWQSSLPTANNATSTSSLLAPMAQQANGQHFFPRPSSQLWEGPGRRRGNFFFFPCCSEQKK